MPYMCAKEEVCAQRGTIFFCTDLCNFMCNLDKITFSNYFPAKDKPFEMNKITFF